MRTAFQWGVRGDRQKRISTVGKERAASAKRDFGRSTVWFGEGLGREDETDPATTRQKRGRREGASKAKEKDGGGLSTKKRAWGKTLRTLLETAW